MFKKIAKTLITVLILLMPIAVNAKPLYIQITGGKNIGVPIAITNFNDDALGLSVADLSGVIRNDLNNSGQFRVIPTGGLSSQPHDATAVSPTYFKGLGAEHVVVGNVIPSGDGTYDVIFQLIDMLKVNAGPSFSMKFTKQRPEKFRALAHHISDLIFEKIIGIRGIFSTRIAYITIDRVQDKTIHTLTVADSDGNNDKPLVVAKAPLMSPSWSPDGKSIAFVSFESNRSAIKTVDVASGVVRQISSSRGINGAPAWSPDGKSLAMVLSKDGSPKIYIASLENKNVRRVTSGNCIDTEPFWDPSGESIVFTSNRGGNPQIYRVLIGSGQISRLTFTGDYNATPSLTPDGQQLVMMHKSEGSFNIAVQSLKTGRVNLLTKANLDESPTIAPNGLMVLYGTKEKNGEILGAVSLDGRFKMRLPVKDGNVKEPAWSPYLS